jgi:pimeloyl-ACP methyl ester carboxylesterase
VLSFLKFRPEQQTKVLVFLHGIGEAFLNTKTGSVGLKNLFQQGVPKALLDPGALLSDDHPLKAGAFTVVAPQLSERETPWTQPEHASQINQVLGTIAPEGKRSVYVIGFSKGGQAAFRLAGDLKAKAILTIDASPMGEDPMEVASEISNCALPFWAIHTNYPAGHNLEKIAVMHGALKIDDYAVQRWHGVAAPNKGARCKSLIALEHHMPNVRHGELCTIVTASAVPYEWLAKH